MKSGVDAACPDFVGSEDADRQIDVILGDGDRAVPVHQPTAVNLALPAKEFSSFVKTKFATTGADLQIPAITRYLRKHGVELQGSEAVDIGTW